MQFSRCSLLFHGCLFGKCILKTQIAGVAEYKGTKLVFKGDQAKWFLLTFKLFELKIKIGKRKKCVLHLTKNNKVLDLGVQKKMAILTVLVLWE